VAKELESCGIPAAQISALDALARSVGANRIVRGKAITSVVGDPSLSRADERRFRRGLVLKALDALRTPVAEPTVVG
jgi:betaine reductase